jgi:predicted amidohydrolase
MMKEGGRRPTSNTSKLIHIAAGSTVSRPGEVEKNLAEIAEFAKRAQEDGVDLLLTPELSVSGYGPYPEVLAVAEPAGNGAIYEGLARIAAETGVVVAAGFPEAAEGKRYLAHYAVYPDGRFVVQRKHRVTLAERPLDPCAPLTGHPPDAEDPADPGQPLELHFTYFEVRGARCGITICADGGITDIGRIFAENGVELCLQPTGAGGRREDRVVTRDLYTEEGREKYYQWLEKVFFPGRAVLDCIKYRHACVAVNQCGFDGRSFYHLGHGMIITPMGEVPALCHGFPNLDRQRPMYVHAVVDVADRLE